MVFHFFERIFGNNGDPKSFFSDRRYSQLVILTNIIYLKFYLFSKVEEGFSEEEAKNLAWLYTHQTSGKIIGNLKNS